MPSGGAAAAAPAAAAEAPAEEKPKEKTIFTVKLEKIDATQKAKVIREVKAIMPNMNLVEVSVAFGQVSACTVRLFRLPLMWGVSSASQAERSNSSRVEPVNPQSITLSEADWRRRERDTVDRWLAYSDNSLTPRQRSLSNQHRRSSRTTYQKRTRRSSRRRSRRSVRRSRCRRRIYGGISHHCHALDVQTPIMKGQEMGAVAWPGVADAVPRYDRSFGMRA